MTPDPAAVWSIDRQVMSRRIGDEQVILHVEKGVYFGLDLVGTRVWELLEATASIEQIAAALVREYEVSHEQALVDASRIVGELLAHGLIRQEAGN